MPSPAPLARWAPRACTASSFAPIQGIERNHRRALAIKTQPKAGLLLNGAKETRTSDPLHAMQLVRSSEFACGNRKNPSIKGISEKLAFKPLWLARASYGGFALKIALSF